MEKLYIIIDANKEKNALALAIPEREAPVLHSNVSADLNRTVDTISNIQKQHDRSKDGMPCVAKPGRPGPYWPAD